MTQHREFILFMYIFQSYVSDVLIAVNPFKTMDKLYSFDIIAQYQEVRIGLLPAHVFGIGEFLNCKLETSRNLISDYMYIQTYNSCSNQ